MRQAAAARAARRAAEQQHSLRVARGLLRRLRRLRRLAWVRRGVGSRRCLRGRLEGSQLLLLHAERLVGTPGIAVLHLRVLVALLLVILLGVLLVVILLRVILLGVLLVQVLLWVMLVVLEAVEMMRRGMHSVSVLLRWAALTGCTELGSLGHRTTRRVGIDHLASYPLLRVRRACKSSTPVRSVGRLLILPQEGRMMADRGRRATGGGPRAAGLHGGLDRGAEIGGRRQSVVWTRICGRAMRGRCLPGVREVEIVEPPAPLCQLPVESAPGYTLLRVGRPGMVQRPLRRRHRLRVLSVLGA